MTEKVKAIARSPWGVRVLMELDFDGLNEREQDWAKERLVTNNVSQVNVNAYFRKLTHDYAEFVVDNYCFKDGIFDYAYTKKKLRRLYKISNLTRGASWQVRHQIWKWNKDNQKATKGVVKKIRRYLIRLIEETIPVTIAYADKIGWDDI